MEIYSKLTTSILCVICILSSCTGGADQERSSVQESRLTDSIVYANRNIDSLEVILARFSDAGNRYGEVAACRELGKLYRNTTRYQEAIDIHSRGLKVAEEIQDTLQIIQAMNNIGTAYRRMGILEDAASWHYKGLTVSEQWSDKVSSVALKNRVVSLNCLGNVHLSLGNDDIAMSSFRDALEGETKLGSKLGMAINCANIGALFEADGQTDSARAYYSLSMTYNKDAGSDLGIALCHNHFGRLEENAGNYQAALKEYQAAYDIMSGSRDRWHWLESCTALSGVYMKTGRLPDAEKYLKEALSVAESLNSAEYLVNIYNLAYKLDKLQGRYESSIAYLEKYNDCVRQLAEERNDNEVFRLKSQYERQKNQNEMKLLQAIHRQELHRDRIILTSSLIVTLLAVIAIVFLTYSVRMRSRNNRMLKELNQTKNNYFTNVAHEFRTPLTVIRSAADAIKRETSEDSPVWEDADDVLRHSSSLLELVNQVMDIARMTSDIAPDPVWRKGNIVSYVSGICEQMRRWSEGRGIALDFVYDEEDVLMDFIPDMVQRIVTNLVSNSVKFSEHGSRVEVSTARCSVKGKDCFRIKVKDHGKGMTPDQIEKAFLPFYQTDSASGIAGSGIGLPVVKLSAEAMGGEVKVRSAIGKGTEIEVDIPVTLGKASLSVGSPTGKNMDADMIPEPSDSELTRILIVEDAQDVARWQMRQLGDEYAFYFASDGAEGLKIATEIIPDLIITDVMMPVMDGVQMCRRIHESELLCHIPVVMVTARTGHEERLEGLEAGADAYLEKPYDEEELRLIVRQLLAKREMLRKRFTDKEGVSENVPDADVPASDSQFLERFDSLLEEAFVTGKVGCEELASALCIGRTQLNRKIKAITGYKTTEYILMARLSKAKNLLRNTDLPVGEISMMCGIEDVGYFSTLFRKHVGMTPSAFRLS